MDTAVETFNKLLADNNLSITLTPITFKTVDDGSFIITPGTLVVAFKEQPKEVKDEPKKD